MHFNKKVTKSRKTLMTEAKPETRNKQNTEPTPLKVKVIPFWADNEIFLESVQFYLPPGVWSEFEGSALYWELTKYLLNLHKQIQEKHTDNRDLQCKSEMMQKSESSTSLDLHESVLVKVHRRFHK